MPFFRRLLSGGPAAALIVMAAAGSVSAQQKSPAPATANQDAAPQQVALTDKQVQGVLDSQKEISDATAKLGDQDSDKVDPKIQAQLDGIAKKHGFTDYADYDKTVTSIGLVLSGFDAQAKKYVGPENVIKQQIEEVKADKEMPPLDKKKALAELEAASKQVTPVQYPDNIKVVTKYYDKLSEALQGD